ncbi:MAG: hypothetical protein JSS49_07175 [Planctomycetes bacterium]|nr:hypothetical protein [Planctomycetota bacterium]
MHVELQIVPSRQPRRDAVAWLVVGSDPAAWVAELARWNIPLAAFVLRPIPRSFADRSPVGVLVTVDAAPAQTRRTDSMAIPYGCIAGRLYLPVEAQISPMTSEPELLTLFPGDGSDLVWHPAAGLVRIESAERLRIADLIQLVAPQSSRWDLAVPGVSFRSRLLSVEPAFQPSAEEILRTSGEDIGANGGALDQLPPAPGEGLGGQIYQWTRPLRNAWKSFWKSPPPQAPTGSASRPPAETARGWGNWLRAAVGPFAKAGQALSNILPRSFVDQQARNREIDRLMHLLKEDPDSGLRFALPVGGDAGRGVASPTNQLALRDINFGLGKLGGGGPTDHWEIPPQQQFQLIQTYRELAAREVRMGRHRRAAYIFAELLGDLQSAAGALESGLHYREAAVLYRDRLKRPTDAARCLERGGLLDEAAELYIELGMMENAADLYVRLERQDEAVRLLRNWAAQLEHQGDHLRASEVLHLKLNDVDDALRVLDAGWDQQATQSEACLKQTFAVLKQHSRHDETLSRVRQYRTPLTKLSQIPAITRVLANVAANHVDTTVRQNAADVTRILVARRLPVSTVAETGNLLASIRSLAPQDRLLSRDCNRYAKTRELPRQSKASKPRRAIGITPDRKFQLEGSDIQWCLAKSNGDSLFALGFARGGLVLRRVSFLTTWFVNHQNIFWSNVPPDSRLLLEVPQTSSDSILVHAVGLTPLPLQPFLGSTGREQAGSPPWATTSTVAFAKSDRGAVTWRLRSVFGTLELAGFGPKSDEITNGLLRVGFTDDAVKSVPVTVCASAKPIRVGVGNLVCRPLFSTDESPLSEPFLELDAEIRSLYNHRDSRSDCVVALFEEGGVMIDEPISENRPQSIAKGIETPTGAFLQDGTFVVAGRDDCRAYRFDDGAIQEIGAIPLEFPAIAVTPTNQLGQFVVLGSDGRAQVFSLNR